MCYSSYFKFEWGRCNSRVKLKRGNDEVNLDSVMSKLTKIGWCWFGTMVLGTHGKNPWYWCGWSLQIGCSYSIANTHKDCIIVDNNCIS